MPCPATQDQQGRAVVVLAWRDTCGGGWASALSAWLPVVAKHMAASGSQHMAASGGHAQPESTSHIPVQLYGGLDSKYDVQRVILSKLVCQVL